MNEVNEHYSSLKAIWEEASLGEQNQFLEWAGLLRRDDLKKHLEILESLEAAETFLAHKLKDSHSRFIAEFEDHYQTLLERIGDLKEKSHDLLLKTNPTSQQ